ncbi:FAD-dependent oxidoreductase [Chloroflexota bacterium]
MSVEGKFSKLFEPGKIGKLELKNRIIMPAMGSRFCGVWGEVTDDLIEWYCRRAQGGCGMVIVEPAHAATAIDSLRSMPRFLRADDTCFITGLSRLAQAIQADGARAGIQLTAGAGVQAKGGPWIPGLQGVQDIEPVSPSGVPAIGRTSQPRVLTTEEIEKIVVLCGNAAWNVKRAGFDMAEIHAHGGYLIAQFMSPYFNKRTDKYGGSFENRCRFLLEIIAAMREAVGPDFPLTVKYSIEDYLPDGWDVKQSQDLAKELVAAGISGIGISSGAHGTKMPGVPPYFYPRGILLPFAEVIKKVVDIPVVVGGRLNDPVSADKAIGEGKTDFVYEGRALIADPDWSKKAASGQIEEIRPCLACNECRQSVHNLLTVQCVINAVAGREGEYDLIKPAEVKKKVLVVGGGPAGLEAARIAALKGHEVILCERYRQVGGLMLLGGIHNEEITAFVKWLVAQIEKLPVDVRLQTEVTRALVEEIKPDAVILAIGGSFVLPEVPGIDRDNVFSSKDLLKLMNGIPVNKGALMSTLIPSAKRAITASIVRRFLGSNFPIKKKVAVIGGQFPGCSLALLLAHKGKKVTMLEESAQFGNDMEAHTMVSLKAEVEAGNVKILTSAKVTEINDRGVVVTDGSGNKTLCEADTVIVALELAPSDSNLARELRGKVKDIYTIGDAKSFRRIMKAVSEGYITAYKL